MCVYVPAYVAEIGDSAPAGRSEQAGLRLKKGLRALHEKLGEMLGLDTEVAPTKDASAASSGAAAAGAGAGAGAGSGAGAAASASSAAGAGAGAGAGAKKRARDAGAATNGEPDDMLPPPSRAPKRPRQ